MIAAAGANSAWRSHLAMILRYGARVAPRGTPTRELLGLAFRCDVRACVIDDARRALNYRYVGLEPLWILAGRGDLAPLVRVNSKMAAFSDDGVTLAGAYGPRLVPQLPYVYATLRDDPSSRQAVATIWTPTPAKSKDIPCTIALQWLLRDRTLHCFATMRSSDAWLGIPYDAVVFASVTLLLASALDATPGALTITAGSAHLYEHDVDAAVAVLAAPPVRSLTLRHRPGVVDAVVAGGPPPYTVTRALTHGTADADATARLAEPWRTLVDMACAPSSAAALGILRERQS